MAPVVRAPCPPDDTLGALVQHVLEADEAARVTAHIDECEDCQQLVVALVRGGVGPTRATLPGVMAPANEAWNPAPGEFPALAAATAGIRIGRYQLRQLLGSGGMGAVYDAYDAEIDRAVALKVLRPELAKTPGLAERLVRESRLMAKLTHPSVITVYDAGREGDAVFIAMEMIRGSTLTAWLASKPHDWRAIVALFERAGQGLAAAHGAGIVHRDFKPDNVLVAHDAQKVVVTDFGIARHASMPDLPPSAPASADVATGKTVPAGITTDGAVVGTPAYMAPEQLAGEAVDQRADVFAFSASLWEALFGARPFPGTSIAEIIAAMQQQPPRPGPGARRVPRQLLRLLRTGLSIDPRKRTLDMPAMLAALAAVRGARKRVAITAGAAGVAGLAFAAVLLGRPASVDRCADALAVMEAAYDAQRESAVSAALEHDVKVHGAVVAKLRRVADAWRATHTATCRAERPIIQDATTTACLDARRIEIAGAVDEIIAGGPAKARYATAISDLVGAPSDCTAATPGALFARIPADRELRRAVTALREQLTDADGESERGDDARALEIARPLVEPAARLWPPLHAEALLSLGRFQAATGDIKGALETLRSGAEVGARAHHDLYAAASWIQLALVVSSDQGAPARALEYLAYAEAAADRIGRPPNLMLRLYYAKGTSLLEIGRIDEGERLLRDAVALAQTIDSDYLAVVTQGLGILYEEQGRIHDAIEAYQQAIAHLPRSPSGDIIGEPVFFERLAVNLANAGRLEEAETEARRAVEIAERTLPETNADRAVAHFHLGEVLQDIGRTEEALAEVSGATDMIAKIQGTRSERYGEALSGKAEILIELGRHAEAERLLARACDIVAFAISEDSATFAKCETIHAQALSGLHRNAEALAKLQHAIPLIQSAYGDSHPGVAETISSRGAVHAALGHHRAAVADFEQAISVLAPLRLEPGYLATARWRLGKQIWSEQPERARAEVVAAIALFETASQAWTKNHDDAVAWLTAHPEHHR